MESTGSNTMRLNVVVGYVTDWSSSDGANSIALNIEGNDEGIRFLIHRLQDVLDGNDSDGRGVQLSADEQPGLHLEPRSMRINMLKLAD